MYVFMTNMGCVCILRMEYWPDVRKGTGRILFGGSEKILRSGMVRC